jgi:hypothetical protein
MDALQVLEPVSERYAHLPVADAFTWPDARVDLGEGEWYMVAFRSVRRAEAHEARLTLFDELAHQEAAGSPGFVHYFKGPRTSDGTCLSFCLWESRTDARAAGVLPAHAAAVTLVAEMYESYTLEFHRIIRAAGAPLIFLPYDQPGVPEHVVVTGDDLHPVVDSPAAPLPATRPGPA